MLYVDIFPEPSIKGALNMLRQYRDEIDDFIIFPDSFRIIPSLHWAALNFENPTIGKKYGLYQNDGTRMKNMKSLAVFVFWENNTTIAITGIDVRFEIINQKIYPSSRILNKESLLELTTQLFVK